MPVYIVHGFRWPRSGLSGVRVFIVLHNVEEAAAEYIQQPVTAHALLDTFKRIEPDIMARLPDLHFIEQHDPDDLSDAAVSHPYAYVADKVITIPENGLGINVEELVSRGSGLSAKGQEALAELRDKYAADEKIGWWVVYNGDPERGYSDVEDDDTEEEQPVNVRPHTSGHSMARPHTSGHSFRQEKPPPVPPIPKEKLRHRLFGRRAG